MPTCPPFEPMSRGTLSDVGSAHLRVRAWRDTRDTALVVPVGDTARLSGNEVGAVLTQLVAHGVNRVYTAALAPTDQHVFNAAGFAHYEHLCLLAHDLREIPSPTPSIRVRRPRRDDEARLLALDHAAFEGFWRLDATGLAEALNATPVARLRLVRAQEPATYNAALGYAVVGHAASRGYLQRLAVHPAAQRQGLGRTLVVDALRWLRRRRAATVLVNTQEKNVGALALYRSLGFRDEPTGLDVLVHELGRTP